MHRIYSQAERVVGWPGKADDSSSHVISLALQSSDYGWEQSKRWFEGRDVLRDLSAITNFFKRDYWSKRWVVQEIALAAQVFWMCGIDSIDAIEISLFQDNLPSFTRKKLQSFLQPKKGPQKERRIFSTIFTLVQGMCSCPVTPFLEPCPLRRTKCADLRDRFYGLHSLFEPSIQNLLIIDYSLSIPNSVINATKAFLVGTGRLAMISWPKVQSEFGGSELYTTLLPSWVPDWGSTDHPRPFASWYDKSTDLADFDISSDYRLRCSGRILAPIAFLHTCPALNWLGAIPSSKEETDSL